MFMAKAWPQEKLHLKLLDKDAIKAMASKFHRTLELKGFNPDLCIVEWDKFKKATFYMLRRQKNTNTLKILTIILNAYQTALSNIRTLVKTMIVLLVSNVDAERGFQ